MRKFVGAVVALLIGSAAQAATIDLDFDENGATAGNIAGNFFASEGVTIELVGAGSRSLALFDTECKGNGFNPSLAACTGDDPDLARPAGEHGLVLIANEGSDSAPDDFAGTYTFKFSFTNPTDVEYVDLIDIDRQEDVKFRGEFASNIGTISTLPATAALLTPSHPQDNSVRRFTLATAQLTTLYVDFLGTSGAIGSLNYTPVPIPATLPLLLGGLGFMGFIARRRRQSEE